MSANDPKRTCRCGGRISPCEQAHSELTGPAVRFGVFRDPGLWLVIFSSITAETSQAHVAGRLHDSLAPTFGRNKLFMDVDNIPVGADFWLDAKDEAGKRECPR